MLAASTTMRRPAPMSPTMSALHRTGDECYDQRVEFCRGMDVLIHEAAI